MTDLNDVLGQEGLAQLTRSWMAYSATNIVLTPRNNLLLGELAPTTVRSIPESGKLVLIGGFNKDFPHISSLSALADAHMETQLGLRVTPEQCSSFQFCEYPMDEITEPLKTPFGAIAIKRMAFHRIVKLTEAQMQDFKPQGKIHAVLESKLVALERLQQGGALSFPYEMELVRKALNGQW